ncbi:hypothetical protein [Paenibacillus sp. JJ-100]|nr:hypothetical protein [Paenibacillus sp. JJ-100]
MICGKMALAVTSGASAIRGYRAILLFMAQGFTRRDSRGERHTGGGFTA